MGRLFNALLWARPNGVGLERDGLIMESALRRLFGDRVIVTIKDPFGLPPSPLYDASVAIHFEVVKPELLRYAKRNLFIANPEWFFRSWLPGLQLFDGTLCRTQDSLRMAEEYLERERYAFIGWTPFPIGGRWPELPEVPPRCSDSEADFIHIVGRSALKGTAEVVRAWRDSGIGDRGGRLLLLHQMAPLDLPAIIEAEECPGLTVVSGKVEDSQLEEWRRTIPVAVQPSYAEGYGYVIAEAAAAGQLVITSDAAPMNEREVSGLHSLLVKTGPAQYYPQRVGRYVVPDVEDLRQKFGTAWIMMQNRERLRDARETAYDYARFNAERADGKGFLSNLKAAFRRYVPGVINE